MKRRRFLQGAAGITVVAVGGGVWRAVDQGVLRAGLGPAYAPWNEWREAGERSPMALVRAGILAASPHNTQPWVFHVEGDTVELYADRSRNLGSFDPYLREMHLGLGCALENMMLAARANGYQPTLELVGGVLAPLEDQPERQKVARITLTDAAAEDDPLHTAIPHRHTNRGPYDTDRPLSETIRRQLVAITDSDDAIDAVLLTGRDERAACAELIIAATEAIIADASMVADSERWFRHSRQEINAHRDGTTLDAAGLSPLVTAMAKMMPRPSAEANHQYWLDATRDVQVATAPAYGLLRVNDLYDRSQALRAGRVWQRMHLWATTQDLAVQPLNQPVERVDRERRRNGVSRFAQELDYLTEPSRRAATFMFRVGYPAREASPSPRRSVPQVLRS